MPEARFDVFLSYTPKDRAVVERFATRLQEAGLNPWFEGGREREEGLQTSASCVVFIGADGLQEGERPELALARERAHRDAAFQMFAGEHAFRLVMVLLPGAPVSAALPSHMQAFPVLDFGGDNSLDEKFAQLRDTLKGKTSPEIPPTVTAQSAIPTVTPEKTVSTSNSAGTAVRLPLSARLKWFGAGSLAALSLSLVIILLLQLLTGASERPSEKVTLLSGSPAVSSPISGTNGSSPASSPAQANREALSRELAATALLKLQNDAELGLLLAVEAARTAPTDQAISALRQALMLPASRAPIQTKNGYITKVAFSPDGTLLFTGGWGKPSVLPDGRQVFMDTDSATGQIWEVSTGKLVSEIGNVSPPIYAADFSPDSKLLLLVNPGNGGRLVEVQTGKVVVEFKSTPLLNNGSASFSPDGKVIAITGDTSIDLRETSTGNRIATLRTPAANRNIYWGGRAVFSADSKYLLAPNGKTVKIWEVSTGKFLYELGATDPTQEDSLADGYAHIICAAWSPDGKRVVTGGDDGLIKEWDVQIPIQPVKPGPREGWSISGLGQHNGWIRNVAYTPDGKYVLSASDDKTVRVWPVRNSNFVSSATGWPFFGYGSSNPPWSPDGNFLITTNDQGAARVWDVSARQYNGRIFDLRVANGIATFAFSRDSKLIATGGNDGKVRLWPLNVYQKDGLELGQNGRGNSFGAKFSPDGKLVIKSSGNKALVYDVATGKEITTYAGHEPNAILKSVDFSPDSKRIVTGSSQENVARVWEATTGTTLAVLKGHTDTVTDAKFSPDGKWIVTASDDKTARLWNATDGSQIAFLSKYDRPVESVAFSPDGKSVVTAGDQHLEFFEVANPTKIVTVMPLDSPARKALFSPDGKLLLVTTYDRTTRIFDFADLKNMKKLATINSPDNSLGVMSASFSPDSKLAVTVYNDVARVFEARTGRIISNIPGYYGGLSSASFSPDSRLLVTAASTGAIVSDAYTGQLLVDQRPAALDRRNDVSDNAYFSPDGKRLLISMSTGPTRIYDCPVCGSLEDLLTLARIRQTRDLTPEERAQYLHEPLLQD